jgi:hypothetical protein
VGKSRKRSIDAVADALSDAIGDVKDEAGQVWDRTFEIATPKRAKRKGRAKKGVAVIAVASGVGLLLTKRREQVGAAAKAIRERTKR